MGRGEAERVGLEVAEGLPEAVHVRKEELESVADVVWEGGLQLVVKEDRVGVGLPLVGVKLLPGVSEVDAVALAVPVAVTEVVGTCDRLPVGVGEVNDGVKEALTEAEVREPVNVVVGVA